MLKTLATNPTLSNKPFGFVANNTKRAFSQSLQLFNEVRLSSIPIYRTRNIGIIAHIDAGKTTTTERLLYYSGKTRRIGNVDQGDTVTDFLPSERERGITIQLAAISIPWDNNKINILDTPGHADFTFEVTRSLRVLDGVVTILDAVEGVEAQTEKVWKQAQELGIPKIAFVNKMDREGAGFSRTVKEIVRKLQTRAVICNMPYFETYNNEFKFVGVIDILNKSLLKWELDSDSNGKTVKVIDIEKEMETHMEIYDMIEKSRESMTEALGEFDERIIDSFLENDENYMKIPTDLLNESIRDNCIANNVTPILCGSAFKNIGVQPLLDAIVAYLPNPTQASIPEITSSRKVKKTKSKNKNLTSSEHEVPAKMDPNKGLIVNDNSKLSVALAFKVVTDKIRGPLTFLRVYSGTLTNNTNCINSRTGKKFSIRHLMLMHGDEPEPIQSISSGNIGVIAGSQNEIITGDTLISHGPTSKSFSDVETNLKLLPIEIPPPLFNSSIEPLTAGDERYMRECIDALIREDPSLKVHQDEELGQTILSGMGELHLDIIRERLVRDMKAKVNLRDVAVSYKETVSKPNYKTIKVSNEDGSISIELELDSFEGEAIDNPILEAEAGAELSDQDNNIIVMEPTATPQSMYEAIEERRWKSVFTLDQLYSTLIQGVTVGLQLGGPILRLPLHSVIVRIKLWDFPIDNKQYNLSHMLEISRRGMVKAVHQLDEEVPGSFTLLEPIMETKVHVSSDNLGDVTHDLTQRCQAVILAIEDETSDNLELMNWAIEESNKIYLPQDYTMSNSGNDEGPKNRKIIRAETPLKEMIGYLNKLRSMTRGRSTFDMSYLGMRQVNASRLSALTKGL